jgi:hypothetical protein
MIDNNKIILLHKEGFTDNEIADKIGCSKITVFRKRKTLGLKTNYKGVNRKKGKNKPKGKPLTGFAHEAFIGHCLGDGSLSKRKEGSDVCGSFAHSIKQKEYFLHKYNLFDGVCSDIKEKNYYLSKTDKNYKGLKTWYYSNPYLTKIYNKLYVNKKRALTVEFLEEYTDVSLAYHYMDDGSYNKNNDSYLIYMCSLSSNELDLFRSYLLGKWGIKTTKRDKQGAIYIKQESMDLFEELISDYIMDNMRYKLRSKKC